MPQRLSMRKSSRSMAASITSCTFRLAYRQSSSGRSCSTTVRLARCCKLTSSFQASAARKKSVVTNADNSVDVYFGPKAPAGKEGNWVQTWPGKGWSVILRLYGPLQPFFDKTWRPSEIEEVN